MHLARNAVGIQSYAKEATILMAAQQKITECNNEYKSLPKHESPISNYTSKIAKLINISYVIISKITSS